MLWSFLFGRSKEPNPREFTRVRALKLHFEESKGPILYLFGSMCAYLRLFGSCVGRSAPSWPYVSLCAHILLYVGLSVPIQSYVGLSAPIWPYVGVSAPTS